MRNYVNKNIEKGVDIVTVLRYNANRVDKQATESTKEASMRKKKAAELVTVIIVSALTTALTRWLLGW